MIKLSYRAGYNKYTGDLWGETEQPLTQSTPEIQPNTGQIDPENQPSNDQNLQQETQDTHKPTPQESFSELRKRAEQAERERNEAYHTIRRIEEYALQQQQQANYKQPEPEPELDDDDYVEARHFKSQINTLKQELNQYKQQQAVSSLEMQIKSRFPDFEKVVNTDNINKFMQLKPELAESFRQTPDSYNKAAAIYTLMKDLGIHQEQTYNPSNERVDTNFNKPRTASSLKKTESALSHASEFSSSQLTEDRKKEIWSQMQKNLRR